MGYTGKISLEYMKGDRSIDPDKKRNHPMNWGKYDEEEENDG